MNDIKVFNGSIEVIPRREDVYDAKELHLIAKLALKRGATHFKISPNYATYGDSIEFWSVDFDFFRTETDFETIERQSAENKKKRDEHSKNIAETAAREKAEYKRLNEKYGKQ